MAKPRERRTEPRAEREKSEFDQSVLDVRRTARVVSGGRRFSFRAVVVVGNRNGKVGIGLGKGPDVASAVEKAAFRAKKDTFRFSLNDAKTISHEVQAKFSSARVILKPTKEGRGLVAGGPVRTIADLAGIKNLTSKILGRTPNKLNNARATMKALRYLNK